MEKWIRDMPSTINEILLRFNRRAETVAPTQLVDTFVDAGPLSALLSSKDHQVMYGRRGTGKTHALTYLVETKTADGDIGFLLDMRTIGSTGGLYADPLISISGRATRLLVDTLVYVHENLLKFSIENDDRMDLSQVGPILDRLADAASNVRVVGTTEETMTRVAQSIDKGTADLPVQLAPSSLGVDVSAGIEHESSKSHLTQTVQQGIATHRIIFGDVQHALLEFAELFHPNRIWIVLDEWSDVPFDLQPYLADFIRRCIFPVTGITVKIGAIEHRSRFRIPADHGGYVGIELGADATADINLDDFMVFDNDAERAKEFFREFLFKHFRSSAEEEDGGVPGTARELIRRGFTQSNAFDEFVRAVEGVPRDAINIIALAAQKGLDAPISVPDIRSAANTWYQRDKQSAVASTPGALNLLRWIIDQVIGERRARAFLLLSDTRHQLIDSLFDSRVLHNLKRNIAAHDQPGVRYDVYKLDFGCYIDLISTAKDPLGLLPLDDLIDDIAQYVEVPPDDYRSIRRAILDLDQFENLSR